MEGDLWEGEGKKSPERGAGVSSGAGGRGVTSTQPREHVLAVARGA
jgi:hypothetical protein